MRQSTIRGNGVRSTDLAELIRPGPSCTGTDLRRSGLLGNRRRSFKQRDSRVGTYFSFAYSSLAVLRIGTSGSASFQIAKKS